MPLTSQPDEFFIFCKDEGIKLTSKCKVLLQALCTVDNFIDAEGLWLLIRDEGLQISRATVYKRLNWLCNKGYARQKKDERGKSLLYRANLPF